MSTRPVDIIFPQAQRPAAISANFCVVAPIGCGQPITGFRDELSLREYAMSGMCQQCQDNFFGV